jgi:probable HAF family extracellular repeat protein
MIGALALSLPLLVFVQTYTITDLNVPSDSYRLAHGMNSAGDVVGEYEPTNLIFVSAFWYNHGTNTDLGVLAGYMDAYAYGINESGQIAGWCDSFAGSERAFLYSNGVMQNLGTLGTLPTGGYSEAYAINNAAQIVGTATLTDTSINHAVLYSGGTKKDLGALGGPAYNSSAFGLNNFGVIVGDSEVTGSASVHAFTYSNNAMSDLQTLPEGSYSRANAVNDSGVIVGEADTLIGAGTSIHAFVCPHGPGSMQDLGTLGGSQSSANAINSAGQIVGYAVDSNSVSRAFLYVGSKMLNLNDLIPPGSGWTNLEAAVGINDAGQIAGYGQFAGGVYHAFLLTPAGSLAVTITNPAPNATFTAPATFVVSASASDTAGTVTNVQFLVNGNVISNCTSVPYHATASNLGLGTYTLTAVASDNGGLKATNSIGIAVTKAALAPITISNAAFSASTFSFSFGTQTGYTYAG